jgi:hypothetical protein
MLETTNYKFKKPELTDSPPDITVMNPNWDKIDTELKAHEGQINDIAPHLSKLVTNADGVHGLKIESGIFTPLILGTSVLGNHNYSIQYGRYYMIGKKVHCDIFIRLSTKDASASGDVVIGGLPVAVASKYSVGSIGQYGNIQQIDTDSLGYTTLHCQGIENNSRIRIIRSGVNISSAGLPIAYLKNNSDFMISIDYESI